MPMVSATIANLSAIKRPTWRSGTEDSAADTADGQE
jgi:hypothetical protein